MVAVNKCPDEINHLVLCTICMIVLLLDNHVIATIIIIVKFRFFIFILFSLGRIDDKIINIIRIPPVNSKKKIIGNQALDVLMNVIKNVNVLKIIKQIVIFTGFNVEDTIKIADAHNTVMIVIILFSLFKVSVLGIEELRERG